MEAKDPSEFKHTSLSVYPDKRVGITLLDEEPGFTGIYSRDKNGGLWPARTVSHEPAKHHQAVCDAWMAGPGINEDKRKANGTKRR